MEHTTGTPAAQPSLITPLDPSPWADGTTSMSRCGMTSELSTHPFQTIRSSSPSRAASSRKDGPSLPSPTIQISGGSSIEARARRSWACPFWGERAPIMPRRPLLARRGSLVNRSSGMALGMTTVRLTPAAATRSSTSRLTQITRRPRRYFHLLQPAPRA